MSPDGHEKLDIVVGVAIILVVLILFYLLISGA